MTKLQLQNYIDNLYIDLEKDMDDNAHSSARMVAKVVNRLYSLGIILEKYNQNNTKNRTLNKIVKESKRWMA
jgi:hypothetical protein